MSPGHALSRDQKQLVSMDGHRGPRRYQGRGDRPGATVERTFVGIRVSNGLQP